ncbi:hypothetical protein [Thalassospira sp. HJ]|uniref:hypothetical protein n=1 Tax=Thalassospira sp. HJ TaxID=1616823 RepID=UPI0006971D99|nr:hypothetical protein [Thalassospira sp. HJ]
MNCFLRRSAFATFVFLLFCNVQSAHGSETLDVVYPLRVAQEKGPHDFVKETLKLVLQKSGVPFHMRPSATPMQQTRAVKELQEHEELTILWAGTSPELERKFLPIRVPIMRGLLGYRLFIIHRDQQPVFDKIRTIEQLWSMHAGQGLGWSDIRILENANLTVTEAPYELIFKLIDIGRLDYFPRGLLEIEPELREFGRDNPNITIEKRLLLVYPFSMFFFVNRENTALADAISRGFEVAYADGSFERLFNQHPNIRSALQMADISNRNRIDIPNPFTTPETSQIPDRYWYKNDLHSYHEGAFTTDMTE